MAILDDVVAALYDPVLAPAERGWLGRLRAEQLAGLSGHVVELGAGTGGNLPHVPPDVQLWSALEPDPAMARRLHRRIRRLVTSSTASAGGAPGADGPKIEALAYPAEALPFDDDSVDAVVSTLVLCTVADPVLALSEARRVLRPGGVLVLLEHVAADGRAGRAQQVIEPVWRPLARGCHLTRDTVAGVAAAGFDVTDVRRVAAPIGGLLPIVAGHAIAR